MLYAPMLPAGVSIGDEAEAQTVPYILGIAHPTGFPAYTLAGWFFSHVFAFGTVAWRLNAFTALCTASTAGGVFLLAAALRSNLAAAAAAALVFAFGTNVWTGALHANAQVLAATCSVYALIASVLFARHGQRRALIAACAFCALGIATHPSAIWCVPAIATAMLWQLKTLSVRTLAFAALAFVLPLSLYAYLPIRSRIVAAQGLDPTSAPPLSGFGKLDWDINSPRTMAGFRNEVFGLREGANRAVTKTFNPVIIAAAPAFWLRTARGQYTIAFLLLATLGAIALARYDPRTFSVIAAGTLCGIVFVFVYRYDRHLDRYMLVSEAVVAAMAAAAGRIRFAQWPAVAALAIIAVLAFVQNRPPGVTLPSENGEAIIALVRREIPDGAIVVAQWNDATALGYGTFVEHSLGSRTIALGWPGNSPEYYARFAGTRPLYLLVSRLAWGRMWAHAPQPPLSGGQTFYRIYELQTGGSKPSLRAHPIAWLP